MSAVLVTALVTALVDGRAGLADLGSQVTRVRVGWP